MTAAKLSANGDTSAPHPARSRNRTGTQTAILQAAKALLADDGFAAFGVNAVARRAGCDKQLVYRYFGGLEGLVDAIGDDLAAWVGDHLLIPDLPPANTYGERLEQVLLRYLDALRADPLMLRIIAWEVSDPSPHVRRLADARSRSLGQWIERMRGPLLPKAAVDAPALNAILIAALQHLALSAAAGGQFVRVSLASDADWTRIKQMVAQLIRALHGG